MYNAFSQKYNLFIPYFLFVFNFYFLLLLLFFFLNFLKLPKVHHREEKKKNIFLHMHLSDIAIFKTFKYNNIN